MYMYMQGEHLRGCYYILLHAYYYICVMLLHAYYYICVLSLLLLLLDKYIYIYNKYTHTHTHMCRGNTGVVSRLVDMGAFVEV